MPETYLQCLVCASEFPFGPLLFGCPNCRRAALVVRYKTTAAQLKDDSQPGVWRWRGLLPPVEPVSLREGNTPLVPFKGLLIKNETVNPTWSWKDRPGTASISVARHFGFKRTVAISTGNHGNSVSAYSAAAGLECTIFCNPEAPDLQLALMSRYGSRVFRGGNANTLVHKMVKRGDVFPASIVCPLGGYANPFGIEGFKTIAFEIFEQLGNRMPDRVFVPAGSGDGIYGIYKGFTELRDLGLSPAIPRMIACQSEGADCYAKALAQNSPRPIHVAHPQTIALSIAEEIGGYPALDAVRASHGDAIAIPDDEIRSAALAVSRAGYAIEPASACSVAVALRNGKPAGETWVAIATGSLVKWPPLITAGFNMPPTLPSDFEDLDTLIPVS